MKLELREIEAAELDKFAKTHDEANFLQFSTWAKVCQAIGEETFYLGFYKKDELVATAATIIKPARSAKYLEIGAGPIMDWKNKTLVKAFAEQIREFARGKGCVYVRIRPNIHDTPETRALVKEAGFKPAGLHLHAENTIMVDLSQTEEELLANMRRQTRYEVRRADKLGIEVGYESSQEAFDKFYDLQQETVKRQGFIPASRKKILAEQAVYGENARIYTAKLDGKVLAQGLIILEQPEAIYLEAASSEEGRKYPGAYAITWRVIRDLKALGFKRYNMFGIAPPNSPHHRYAGVTTFKKGFGGEEIAFLHAHDLPVKKLHYAIFHIFEEIRKKRRHL